MATTAVRTQRQTGDGDVALAMLEAAEATGMRVQEPTIIAELPNKYVFRSEPGRILADKGYDFYFDAYNPKWDDPDDLPEQRRWAKLAKANWERRNAPDMRAALAAAVEELGGRNKITFRSERTPLGRVCSYGTDSDAVAIVIRDGIKRGLLTYFKDESAGNDRYYVVGERAYANTPLGRELAMAESERTGEAIVPQKKD